MTTFDADLLRRYDINGPRYTSYPTAPHFHTRFGEVEYRKQVRLSNEDPIPKQLSLYIHSPFCASPCFYCGCTRIITRDRAKAESYLFRLYREIELTATQFDRDRSVVQLHFGGGTPNFFDASQLRELMESLDQHFHLSRSEDREFGIEIDPRYANADYVHMLADSGFNRISIGIQDFDPAVQLAVNRIQSIEQTRVIIDAARQYGFRSINVDLIYGLPNQSLAGFMQTLRQVIALQPDRIAAYSYAHLPELFKAQRQIYSADLPDAASKLALLGQTIETLTAVGYCYIGMDHFALPGDELVQAQQGGTLQRNFQGYSTHAECDLVGLGMSAISQIGNSYSQNAKDLIGYYAAIDAGRLPVVRGLLLDEDDLIRRSLINQLMCHGVIDIPAFSAHYRMDFSLYFAPELERIGALASDGLIDTTPERISVTSRGRLLLRTIAMAFDAYLVKQNEKVTPFSRTV